MNSQQNEKQLMPIRKIIFTTVILGILMIGLALITGTLIIDDGGARFGHAEIEETTNT